MVNFDGFEWAPFGDGWVMRENADEEWEEVADVPDEVLKAYDGIRERQHNSQMSNQIRTIARFMGISEEEAGTLQATQPSASGTVSAGPVS